MRAALRHGQQARQRHLPAASIEANADATIDIEAAPRTSERKRELPRQRPDRRIIETIGLPGDCAQHVGLGGKAFGADLAIERYASIRDTIAPGGLHCRSAPAPRLGSA